MSTSTHEFPNGGFFEEIKIYNETTKKYVWDKTIQDLQTQGWFTDNTAAFAVTFNIVMKNHMEVLTYTFVVT